MDGDYDKMGVFQEVVSIATARLAASVKAKNAPQDAGEADGDLEQLKRNVIAVCDFVREALAVSRAATAKYSATQAMKRIIRDFQRLNKTDVPITNLQKLVNRLEREVVLIGGDGEQIRRILNEYSAELNRLRTAGQERVAGAQWIEWQQRLEKLKNSPLQAATS